MKEKAWLVFSSNMTNNSNIGLIQFQLGILLIPEYFTTKDTKA
jgi:hypothetical protein